MRATARVPDRKPPLEAVKSERRRMPSRRTNDSENRRASAMSCVVVILSKIDLAVQRTRVLQRMMLMVRVKPNGMIGDGLLRR